MNDIISSSQSFPTILTVREEDHRRLNLAFIFLNLRHLLFHNCRRG